MPLQFNIPPLPTTLDAALRHKIDTKTKPLGALGQLEALALQAGRVQGTLSPQLRQPQVLVFAGDHGIAAEGVSAYPQEVTWQMVINFLAGGAAVNVFARQMGMAVRVVDAGVNHDFAPHPGLVDAKVGRGTRNSRFGPAMTHAECELALQRGAELAREAQRAGSNVLAFGEMGIANTSAAALLLHKLGGIPIEEATGRGTGVDDAGLAHKRAVLAASASRTPGPLSPFDALAEYGGFEIAMMAGAMLAAAEARMLVLVDGFIATSALLVASGLHPAVREVCVFAHCSAEAGHRAMLKALNAVPLLNLDLRLGEGTGAVLAYGLLQAAVAFLNEMASFESAAVSGRD
ncbi:MAG: nicotinate-nucleotide--dimethylbenzimidazole phosphoribosyltransferase [Burkholderiales bacterium]